MGKKSLLAITVVLGLVLGVVAMSVGSAAGATTAAEAAAKGATRLVLIVREVDSRDIDVEPVGEENPGDTFLATEDAFSPGGRLIGYDQVRFTLMFREEVFVEATFVINGRGQIVVEGLSGFTEERPALAGAQRWLLSRAGWRPGGVPGAVRPGLGSRR